MWLYRLYVGSHTSLTSQYRDRRTSHSCRIIVIRQDEKTITRIIRIGIRACWSSRANTPLEIRLFWSYRFLMVSCVGLMMRADAPATEEVISSSSSETQPSNREFIVCPIALRTRHIFIHASRLSHRLLYQSNYKCNFFCSDWKIWQFKFR